MPESVGNAAYHPQLRRLVAYSTLSGICPLIPIPLLDDWALKRIKRHHATELAARFGIELDSARATELSGGGKPTTGGGCLSGCVLGAVLRSVGLIFRKLLGGLVRKLLFFLALKDCAHAFSASLHELILLNHVFEHSYRPGRELEIRAAIDSVSREVDSSVVTQLALGALTSSRLVLVHAARTLGHKLLPIYRAARRGKHSAEAKLDEAEDRAVAEMEPLIDLLTTEIAGRRAHLDGLCALLDDRLPRNSGPVLET